MNSLLRVGGELWLPVALALLLLLDLVLLMLLILGAEFWCVWGEVSGCSLHIGSDW